MEPKTVSASVTPWSFCCVHASLGVCGGGGGRGGAELQSMFWGVLARANCSKQMGRCKKMSVHPRCDKGTSRTNVINMYIRSGSW